MPLQAPRPRSLILFSYDWDQIAFSRLAARWPHVSAGFDLFSFPSNARLAWFDMQRFVALWAWRARRPAAAIETLAA